MNTIIYAATDATFIEIDYAKFRNPPVTFVQSGKGYRRLTPEYWAWFLHKYHVMENALINKKISEATFVEILNRISTLYNQALARYGADALKKAVATTDVKAWEKTLHGTGSQPGPDSNALPASHKSETAVSSVSAAT